MDQNKDPENIPCHRVVSKDGSCLSCYAFGGKKAQEEKLRQEADLTKR
ncbi:MAG: MGMT family protein [Chlamydiae bacterium]|nr:MGMT family protein [Chlamydiota bacterium]